MKPLTRPWSPEEIEKLKKLGEEGASVMRCSAALNRSGHSIMKAARSLGIELKGVRATKAAYRRIVEENERDLPKGSQRNDGTFV